jgi:hypothetical protein
LEVVTSICFGQIAVEGGIAGVRPLKWNKNVVDKKQDSGRNLWLTRTTLSKAFALGGCAICNAVHAAERKGIHSFLYEGMMFPFVRRQFLEGGGFCLRHFWMAKEIEDETWPTGGFGMAILCESLTHFADAGLSEVAAVEPNARPTLLRRREAHMFLPGHDCIFCQDNREKEQFLAEVLENLVDEAEFQKPLATHGLCIRHGELALQIWKDQEKRKELFAQLRTRVAELAADLREFIRKRDYQYRSEPPGREQDSLLRAIWFFVGPDPCGPRTKKETL